MDLSELPELIVAEASRPTWRSGPSYVQWIYPVVLDASAAAVEAPALFTEYLRAGHASGEEWSLRKLLPKRLRDTLPSENPAIAIAAAMEQRRYWNFGSPDGLLARKFRTGDENCKNHDVKVR